MIEQGNDDGMTVKANQKSLHQHLCVISRDCPPVSGYPHAEQGHQRQTQRTVEVVDCLAGIAKDWLGLRRFGRVQRHGTRQGRPDTQWRDYITSLATTARQFAEGIRGQGGLKTGSIGSKMSCLARMIVGSNSLMHRKTGD